MKKITCVLMLFIPMLAFCQNVGINATNPSEKLHIQDNESTKLLLRTSNGTSFFTADSPSNSGLLFRSAGIDKGNVFYSSFSNTLSANVGLNGWTLFANGDFKVKERIYSIDDLRLDAQERVTIEANGAIIEIEPDGSIKIQGSQVTIEAEEDLNINANNINITAGNQLHISSGGGSSYQSGNDIEFISGNDMAITASSDFNITSENMDINNLEATNFSSGTGLALTSENLSINTGTNASLNVGNNFTVSTGNNLGLVVGNNYNLSVVDDYAVSIGLNHNLTVGKIYDLNIGTKYQLNASTVTLEAINTNNILGGTVKFNNGTTGFARIGDEVVVGGKLGVITTGSNEVLGN